MNRMKFSIGGCLAIIAVMLFACSKNNSGNNNPAASDAFKQRMLLNYCDTLFIPGYTQFNTQVTTLDAAITEFLNDPVQSKLDALRNPFKNTYLAFENISMPYFGPASALLLNNTLNSFPSKTADIENAIIAGPGSYNFNQPLVSDSIQGLPALDYLLFSTNTLQKFQESTSANRKQYVRDIMTKIKTLATSNLTQWNGSYRSAFTGNLQTNVGSPIGYVVNQLAYEMDAMKGPRIGWPFGKRSNGIVFADKCEAYYSGFSGDLATANLTALKKYFTGGTGTGIDDYLVEINRTELKNTVLNQFDVAINAVAAIPAPLSASFSNNAPAVENAYREVQKLLTYLKTDVASATAVQITYMDNDGD
ncbi:MAG: imelysin family protein [Bacteroidota bacterium]